MNTYRKTINLLLDLALAMAFLVLFRPVLTGLAIHEWLGLALGGALIGHLLLHWRWARGVIRQWLSKLPFKKRVYALIDVSLLVGFLTIIGSGVAMSRGVLPLLGVTGSTGSAWFVTHKWSSMLALALVGIKRGVQPQNEDHASPHTAPSPSVLLKFRLILDMLPQQQKAPLGVPFR